MKTLSALTGFVLGVLATLYTQDYRDATAKADAVSYIASLRERCQPPTSDWMATVVVDSRTGKPACLKIPPQQPYGGSRPIIVQTLNGRD